MKYPSFVGRHGLLLLVTALLGMAACSKSDMAADSASASGGNSATTASGSVSIDSIYTSGSAEGSSETGSDDDDLVENNFLLSATVTIAFGSAVTVNNPLDGKGVSITEDDNNLVINASVAGVAYKISGSTAGGSIKIYSDKKSELILDGISIASSDRPAINIQSKKTTFVICSDDTQNTLSDGTAYTAIPDTEDAKAALFSEGQLVFGGAGSLTVKGNYKHGICSDDYIRVRGGNITVTSTVKDAIHTNDHFILDGGTLSLTSADDGIQVDDGYVILNDGILTIHSTGKAITADYDDEYPTVTPYLVINGGSINIISADEGIESKGDLSINDGDITVKSSDDGINAGVNIYINGGRLYSYATANDAIDANGLLTVTGGTIVAVGSREPEASFDCDARTFKITGGMIVGIGGATSGPSESVSTIHSLIMGSGTSGQIIHIKDSDGDEVMTFKAPESFTTLIYGSSKLKANKSYTVYTGGTVSDGTDFNGLYLSGTYSGGTSSGSFITTNMVTQIGGSISRG